MGQGERTRNTKKHSSDNENFLINVGVFDLLSLYGRRLGESYPTVADGTVVMWIAILCALGFAARKGRRWACLLGIALYSPDMVALMVTFSIWAFGVHGFFVFRWFQGQKALQDLKQLATLPRFDEYGAECHNIRVFCECMGFSSPVP